MARTASVPVAGTAAKPDEPDEPPRDVPPSNIKSDEVVRLLPTYAQRSGDTWTLPIEAWVYEPERDGVVRRVALAVVAKVAQLELDSASTQRLVRNMAPFLVDNESGKHVVVQWGTQVTEACETRRNGRCSGSVTLDVKLAERIASLPTGSVPVVEVRTVLRDGDPREFATNVFLLEDDGVSVISDIDDTIKITSCHDKVELLRNTMLREPTPTPGQVALYRRWASDGAAFHYVSNSPLPLLGALTTFLADAGFPLGSIALKPFRWTDGSFLELLAPPEDHKQAVIEAMVAPWSKRTFVLVGDTGERDPEIYAAVARKFPARVRKIYLRDPQGGTGGLDARLDAAFEGLPASLWQVYGDGHEVTDTLQPSAAPTR